MMVLDYMHHSKRFTDVIQDNTPDMMVPIFDYFVKYYALGFPATELRRALPLQYPPALWNTTLLANLLKTNNVNWVMT